MKRSSRVSFRTIPAVAWICWAALSPLPAARAQTSLENVRVTDGSSGFPFQAETTIVVDGQGRIFAGWKEMNVIEGFNRVGFGRSLDGGRTWSRSLMEVLVPAQLQSDPWLAIDEFDRVYFSRTGAPGIMVSRSDDGGLTWGPLVDVHDQPDSADKSSIKSDGSGMIYASYVNFGSDAPLNIKIIFRRSVDGGVTWSPGQVLVTGLNPFAPVIATRPNGTVHVVWWAPVSAVRPGGNIIARASTDRGATWGTAVRVNPVSGSALFNGNIHPIRIPYPSATADASGSVFVAWADTGKGNYNVVVARSADGGATWSGPVQVNDADTGDHWMPALTVDANGVLHAAWYDSRTGNINLFYANSTDGGKTWSPNLRITTQETPLSTQSLGEYIGLAADRNGAAYLVWADGRDGGLDIYFARTPGIALVPKSFSFSPPALNFLNTVVGRVSATQTVIITNATSSPVTLRSVAATGDFVQSNNCPSVLAAGAGCTASVSFHPSAVGNRAASLTVTSRAGDSPQNLNLSGNGVDFTIALSRPSRAPRSAGANVILAGQSGTRKLVLAGSAGFAGTVALSCRAPARALSCQIEPAELELGSEPRVVLVTVRADGEARHARRLALHNKILARLQTVHAAPRTYRLTVLASSMGRTHAEYFDVAIR